MVFGGIQKLTLLDYPDKTACTLFVVGCNYDCPFCYNTSLIRPCAGTATFSVSEVIEFLRPKQGLLDGVCISGGEPLIHDGLGGFIDVVKAMGFLVKLDTNGSFPDRLKKLVASGRVDYVAMDIKNTPTKYAQTIGLPEYDVSQVEESMAHLRLGLIPYELRTTVVRQLHTTDDLLSVARWIKGTANYYLQGYTDFGEATQSGLSGYSKKEMEALLIKIKEILPTAKLRGG